MLCSGRTLDRLSAGEVVSLLIETHVRQDHIHLYGFLDAVERNWFRLLTTVQGVGAKVALAILTVLPPDVLAPGIAAGDRAAITGAAGVGTKLATRIVSELKDRAGAIAFGPAAGTGAGAPPAASTDAISALVNLGYSPTQSLGAVSQAARRLGPEADAEALIRAGLRELAPREHGG